jgi:hypothetical protein
VADGDSDRPPYATALGLGAWGWERRSILAGRITLAGGTPEGVSLPRFLDCATTMLYEEFQRVGQSAFEAFDQVRGWAEGSGVVPKTRETKKPPPDNDRSMAEFMAKLSGVGGMPG